MIFQNRAEGKLGVTCVVSSNHAWSRLTGQCGTSKTGCSGLMGRRRL